MDYGLQRDVAEAGGTVASDILQRSAAAAVAAGAASQPHVAHGFAQVGRSVLPLFLRTVRRATLVPCSRWESSRRRWRASCAPLRTPLPAWRTRWARSSPKRRQRRSEGLLGQIAWRCRAFMFRVRRCLGRALAAAQLAMFGGGGSGRSLADVVKTLDNPSTQVWCAVYASCCHLRSMNSTPS